MLLDFDMICEVLRFKTTYRTHLSNSKRTRLWFTILCERQLWLTTTLYTSIPSSFSWNEAFFLVISFDTISINCLLNRMMASTALGWVKIDSPRKDRIAWESIKRVYEYRGILTFHILKRTGRLAIVTINKTSFSFNFVFIKEILRSENEVGT